MTAAAVPTPRPAPRQETVPLLVLWRYCNTDDEDQAHAVSRLALAEGATVRELARAHRIRDERLAGEVTVVYGGTR